MANSFVQLPPDSTGKLLQTYNNTVGANSVHSESVTLSRGSDNTEVGTSAQPLRVDPTGTTVQPVSGTVTANAGTGTMAVSLATLPSLVAGTAIVGKVGIDQTTPGTTNGVQVNAALPAGTNLIGKTGIDQTTPGTTNKVSIGTDGTVAINAAIPAGTNVIGHVITDTGSTTAVTGTVTVSGTVTATVASNGTTGSAVPASADSIGLTAATAYPTAVTGGQLVGAMGDKAGRAAVVINSVRDLVGTASLDSSANTATTLIAAGAAGVFNDITELIITNEGTATVVSLSDGTTTYKYAIAANGGLTKSFISPLVQVGSATAWTVLNSASQTLHYTVCYVKNH